MFAMLVVVMPAIAVGAQAAGPGGGKPKPTTYSIAGVVKLTAHKALAGVTVLALKGTTEAGSAVTNAKGQYKIEGLAAGAYTVVPALAGYTFTPRSQRNVRVPPSKKNVSFMAKAVPQGGLSNGAVDPLTGTPATNFTFSVTYTNLGNQPPKNAAVVIDPRSDGETVVKLTKDPNNSDYANGVVYTGQTTLGVGEHKFQFRFLVGAGKKWTLSGSGPTVNSQ
jgi:hypothetical protein